MDGMVPFKVSNSLTLASRSRLDLSNGMISRGRRVYICAAEKGLSAAVRVAPAKKRFLKKKANSPWSSQTGL